MITEGHLFPVSANPVSDYILPHNTFGPMSEDFEDISIETTGNCHFQQPMHGHFSHLFSKLTQISTQILYCHKLESLGCICSASSFTSQSSLIAAVQKAVRYIG